MKELQASHDQLLAKHANLLKESELKGEEAQSERDIAKKNMDALQESNQTLLQSIRLKEEQIEAMVKEGCTKQLKELQASYDQLLAKHADLLKESELQSNDAQSERNNAKKNIDALQESNQTLRQSICSMEEQIRTAKKETDESASRHKNQLKELIASHDKLLAKHSAFHSESERNIKESRAECNDAKKNIQSLEQSICLKEEQIRATKKEAEESASRHKKQLKGLIASHDKLLAKHTALQSESKLKNKEAQAEVNNAKKHIDSLTMSNQSLEQSINSKEEQIRAIKKETEESARSYNEQLQRSKASYDQLLAKHTAFQGESELRNREAQNHFDALAESNQSLEKIISLKEDQIRAMKKEVEESKPGYMLQLKESKLSYDQLLAEQTAFQNESDKDAHANMNIESLQESNRSLEQAIRLKEEQVLVGYMDQLKESKASYDRLLAKHTDLQSKTDMKINEVQAECNNFKRNIDELKESNLSLKQLIHTKEEKILSTFVEAEETKRGYMEQLSLKDQQILTMKEETEELEHDYTDQLKASKASYDQLLAKQTALQREFELKNKELYAQTKAKTKTDSLQQSNQSLAQSIRLKEDQIQAIKKEAEQTERGYIVQLKKSADLQDESDKKIKEVQAECNNAKKNIDAMKDSIGSLEQSIRLKEEQIETMLNGTHVSKHGYTDQLKESKAFYDELLPGKTALKNVPELKDNGGHGECTDARTDVDLLQESNRSLEQSIRSKEEHIQMMENILKEVQRTQGQQIKEMQSSYDQLRAKHTALQNEFELKNKELQSMREETIRADEIKFASQDSNRTLEQPLSLGEDQSQTIMKGKGESGHVHQHEPKELHASQDQLLLNRSTFENRCNDDTMQEMKNTVFQSARSANTAFEDRSRIQLAASSDAFDDGSATHRHRSSHSQNHSCNSTLSQHSESAATAFTNRRLENVMPACTNSTGTSEMAPLLAQTIERKMPQESPTTTPNYDRSPIHGNKPCHEAAEASFPICELMCEHFDMSVSPGIESGHDYGKNVNTALHTGTTSFAAGFNQLKGEDSCNHLADRFSEAASEHTAKQSHGQSEGDEGRRSLGQGRNGGQYDPSAQYASNEIDGARTCTAGLTLHNDQIASRGRKRKSIENTESADQSQDHNGEPRHQLPRVWEASEIQAIHWQSL